MEPTERTKQQSQGMNSNVTSSRKEKSHQDKLYNYPPSLFTAPKISSQVMKNYGY